MYKFLWSGYILVIWVFIQTPDVHGNTGGFLFFEKISNIGNVRIAKQLRAIFSLL
jgi:hypothetical protein